MNKNKEVKMVKKKFCKQYFLGYWKREPIALIPQYRQGAKPEDCIVEEREVPANHPAPRILDPNTTPLSVVKEICRFNDVPFFWITGISPETLIETIKNISLAKAIEHFLVFGTNGTTLPQYRRIFRDLIGAAVIDPDVLVVDYLKKSGAIEADALSFSSLEKTSDKKRYNYNDKIYNILKSFHLFLRNPNHFVLKYKKSIEPTTERESINPSQLNKIKSKIRKAKCYRANRKNCMTEEEALVFFPALKSINHTHELIARILWWFNHEICDHPDAPCVHLESVLKMQPHDIGRDSFADIRDKLPDNVGGNCINICSKNLHTEKIFSYYVRGSMYVELFRLAQNTDDFIFRNKFGGSIDPRQVRKSFAEACKKASLRSITPNQLR